jgi:UPF0755 protein
MGAAALLATVGWVSANELFGFIKPDITAVVEVTKDDTLSSVAEKLKAEGIINYPFLFRMYGSISHAMDKIDPGTYELSADLDYRAMIYAMRNTSSYRATVWVTIPEGLDQEEILRLLDEKGVCAYADIAQAAKSYDFSYDYIKGLTKTDNRLEGYLFPDTYEFYINESPSSAINKLLSNFDRKLTADLRQRAEDMGLTIHQAVTLASLIEKEAADDEERPIIPRSSTTGKSEKYPLLQPTRPSSYCCPSARRTERRGYEIESPYNTYLHKGLPPGPIASPGLASIKAALYPDDTKYYFYALDKDGKHHFSKTIEEHEAFLASLKY